MKFDFNILVKYSSRVRINAVTERMKNMTSTDEQIAETTMAAAAEMAKALGMTQEEDMTTLREDQYAMMVTATGIVVGKIRVVHQEKRTVRFVSYLLINTILSPAAFSETLLCKYRFGENGKGGWFEEPDIICSLPEGAVLYTR